ncbi:hypothetical protein KCH_70750 [Kitasatospora cheerisanensis KCTC 2395]|uniref:DUF4232 domain-containing protein n=1 Tax=Kitasatospora cheerisanensis KCTC 2395 TaxID=1348663 RepID=A0A066YI51_9ACTN|nr:hypothetical protein KCH_70750 [Kitasatospora cheerisanensis KCTC 2395]
MVAALGVSLTACAEQRPVVAPAAPVAPVAAELPLSPVLETAAATPARRARGRDAALHGGGPAGDGLGGAVAGASDGPVVERIELANRSASTCTMKGYPTVELLSGGDTWTLPDSRSGQVRTVTLPPGGTANVLVDYQPYRGRGQRGQTEFKVTSMVLTPPEDSGQLTVHWEGANPQDRRTAGQSGTQVRPVTATR